MKILEDYKQVMFRLALAFEEHKDPSFKYEGVNGLSFPGHFPGEDYGMYCDSSEFYSWTPSEMYLILSKNIPYDIATEHQDISIGDKWDDLPKYNLDYYYLVRKQNLGMTLDDFLMHLRYEYHISRARVNTSEFKKQTEEYIKEAINKFKQDIGK